MKVLFVINSSNNGGAPKMIVTLYREMKKYNPSSKIVFMRRVLSQYSDIEDAHYLTDKLSSPFDYLSAYKKLYKIVQNEKPDALISFLPLSNIFSAIIGKRLGVKIRIASQRNPPQIYGSVVRFLDKYIGSRGYYTANVCNSKAGMEAFDSYPETYKKLLSVINNCVEPADLSIPIEVAKQQLGLTEDKVVLTCVGRLHEQKNHKLLVKAMKYIDNAVLYCAGGGPLHDMITTLIEEEGVADKVVLMGDLDRDEVRQLLRATDIFVIPSLYEGLSNSLIEALSYGLPVVFSNISSFTSFMKLQGKEGYAGILVDSNDEKEWAVSIKKIITDKDLRLRYQRLSFDKVSNLTAEKMTLCFREVLNKPNKKDTRKVLAVASAGGHWIQLLRLSRAFDGHELVYMSTKKGFGSLVEGHEFHVVGDANRKDILGLIKSFFQILKLVFKIKPNLIVTTGAAPGLMCILAGRLLGARTVWVDSIANVEELSMSGTIATKVAHTVYTQWPDLAGGKVKYSGNILS